MQTAGREARWPRRYFAVPSLVASFCAMAAFSTARVSTVGARSRPSKASSEPRPPSPTLVRAYARHAGHLFLAGRYDAYLQRGLDGIDDYQAGARLAPAGELPLTPVAFETTRPAGASEVALGQVVLHDPLVDPEVWERVCAVDWAPTPGLADPLLIADMSDYVETGETHIHRVPAGSDSRTQPVTTFDDYVRIVDMRWIPDGSGFLVARQDGLLDEDINIYEYTFATGALRKVTDIEGGFVRSFSVAPDGVSIAFERIEGAGERRSQLVLGAQQGLENLQLLVGQAYNPHAVPPRFERSRVAR